MRVPTLSCHLKRCFEKVDKDKNDTYLHLYLEHMHHFIPLVFSVDSIPGAEVQDATQKMALHLVFELNQEYSEMYRFLQARMALEIVSPNTPSY